MNQLWKRFFIMLSIIILIGIISLQAQDNQLYIAYVSRGEVNDDIFLTNLNNTVTYNLTDSRSRDWHPSWSANGAQITFNSDRSGNPDIFIMNANGSDPINITNNSATDVSPDWAPVNNEIVFISDRDGGFDLYVYKIDIGTTVRLTIDGTPKSDPDWAPNGQDIVYWELEDDTARLVTINVETGETRTLIDEGQNLWPAWSPDGESIVFHSGVDGDDDIFRYDLVGGSIIDLTNSDGNQKNAGWSPDGEQLVFVSDRNGTENLYTMNADGSDVERLTNAPNNAHSPAWQPIAVDIDFSNTALGQNVNIVQSDIDPNAQEVFGVGEARLFAPETSHIEDIIRVRVELAVESDDPSLTPAPTPDIPLRDERALEISRFMGARLVGMDLGRFEVFPEQTDYLLEMNPDAVNYWEWYLRPLGDEALGRRFLAVEIYLPEVENDGAIVQTVLETMIFEVEITREEQQAPSEYTQDDLMPDPSIGLTIAYSDDTSLSIIFTNDTDISDVRIGTAQGDFALLGDFPIFNQSDNLVPSDTCLFYELTNSQIVLPRACRNDNSFNIILAPIDIFWFDDLENRLLDVIIRFDGRAYPCTANLARCDY